MPPPPPGMPGSVPPPVYPMPGQQAGYPMGRPAVSMATQFTGPALWAIILGLAGILVPIFFNYVFFLLPIIGLISAVQAIRTGRVIGGIVGIVLNIIAGIITIFALFVH
jgi:hypothetical protein